jgi:hypothetical protein
MSWRGHLFALNMGQGAKKRREREAKGAMVERNTIFLSKNLVIGR